MRSSVGTEQKKFICMIQNFSCVLHPYHCEYLRLGGFHTEEGSKYSRRYHFEMMREYEEKMKTTEYRFELGGSKVIHGID